MNDDIDSNVIVTCTVAYRGLYLYHIPRYNKNLHPPSNNLIIIFHLNTETECIVYNYKISY